MPPPVKESLADFGKKYRTLFIIGEFKCSGSMQSERLAGKGRLLLADFVTSFCDIRKTTRSTITTVQDLDVKASQIRITCNSDENKHRCETISEALRQALNKLQSVGSKRMEDIGIRMIKFRERDASLEVSKLESKVKELELQNYDSSSPSSAKGYLAYIASSFRLVIKLPNDKSSQALTIHKSPLEAVQDELSNATEIVALASKTHQTIQECTIDWLNLFKDIRYLHTNKIVKLLEDPASINIQQRGKIREEIATLKGALEAALRQLDEIYKDIDAQYGPGQGIDKQVDEFQTAVAQISSLLTDLSSAKAIVHKNQHEDYHLELQKLAKISLDQLEMVQIVFEEWIIYIKNGSVGPLLFIDDAFQLNMDTAEAFERRWGPSYERLRLILCNAKKRPSKKAEFEGTPITSGVEASGVMKNLEESRPGAPERGVDSGIAVDPFAVAEEKAMKAYGVLKAEIGRLKLFLDPSSSQ
ncbi:hypothetical protein NP233_g9990 [Leucocoprinus birnbaumii]|uniref:Uncharacterized protein n=1 Tax=Leucocoprinus birnbaumii TaxID=56174 RepID=A0AAD5VJP0_9AGAR|nr:hypothetical protein NP233_g9990 [Leucocoprinus birnbaumii]